jgi:hypothetical protein
MTVYLITLIGQGDTECKVVDKDTLNWINAPSDQPKDSDSPLWIDQYSWIDSIAPEWQTTKAAEEDADITVTSGSYQNDRALISFSLPGYDCYYRSVGEAISAVEKNGDTLGKETYEGYIY